MQQQQQYSPQGMQMQPMQQQHQQVMPMQQQMSPVVMTGVAMGYPAVRDGRPLGATETLEHYKRGVVYRAQLSDDAKWLGCTMGRCANPNVCLGTMTCAPLCDCLYFESKLKTRSYIEVQENRVETNYAFTCCFGQTVCDDIRVTHLDKFSDSVKAESCCTPFHCCCCIECCGGVVATAPMSCCNNCFCPCFRTYYPGLSNAQGFNSAILTTRAQFREGKRLTAGALNGPQMVQMS